MATEIIKTIKASGGDYTSRSAFEAAVPADLVTLDEQWSGVIDAFEDTTAVTVSGITTDATRYVEFRVAAGQGHAGKWDDTKARLAITAGVDSLTISVPYTRVIGDQVKCSTNNNNYFDAIVVTAAYVRIVKCIIKESAGITATIRRGIAVGGISGDAYIINNIVYDFITVSCIGISCANASGKTYVYNNTVHNCTIGFGETEYQVGVLKNNVAQNCTDGFSGSFFTGTTNNCSDIASDAPGANPRTGNVLFVDEAGDDFHLASGDTVALGYGADLSADANYPFTNDIDGQTRSGSWDIGADEYVAAGGGLIKLIAETLNISDGILNKQTKRRYITETMQISDLNIRLQSLRRYVTETLQIAESVYRTISLRKIISETIQIADSIIRLNSLRRYVTETMQITDSALRYIQKLLNKIISESLQISDSVLRRISIGRYISDTLQIADSIVKAISLRKIVSDTLQLADSIVKAISIRKVVSDTIQISDQVIRSVLGAMVRIASETLNLTESVLRRLSYRRVISESENVIEAINRRISFRRVISETQNVIEGVINNKFFSKIVNEIINITEQIRSWLGVLGAAIIKVINETIRITDITGLFKIIYLTGKKAVIFTVDNIKRTFTVDNIKRTFTVDNIKRTFYGK